MAMRQFPAEDGFAAEAAEMGQYPPQLHEPQETGAFFTPYAELPEEFCYDNEVTDWQPYKEPERHEEGTIWHDRVQMSDGVIYNVLTGQPDSQRTEVPIDFTTAWWTSTEGHNKHTMLKFMGLGFPVRLIGPERRHVGKLSIDQIIENIKLGFEVELAYSAHNFLQIVDSSDKANRRTIHSGQSIIYGESRAAMIELGVQALAADHGREVVFSEALDPTFAEPLDLTNRRDYLERMLPEAVNLIYQVGRILLSRKSRHYARTIEPSLDSFLLAIGAIRTFKSGQAGELARLIPHDADMLLRSFTHSIASQGQQWEEIFRHHSRVHVEQEPGTHTSILNVLGSVVIHFAAVRDELVAHGDNPEEIELERVYTKVPQAA